MIKMKKFENCSAYLKREMEKTVEENQRGDNNQRPGIFLLLALLFSSSDHLLLPFSLDFHFLFAFCIASCCFLLLHCHCYCGEMSVDFMLFLRGREVDERGASMVKVEGNEVQPSLLQSLMMALRKLCEELFFCGEQE